jgi:tetratricopeptide (TPR) repeat protein
LQEALDTPRAIGKIPLRLTAFSLRPEKDGKIEVTLASEIAARTLHLEKGADGALTADLDVLLTISHAQPDASRSVSFPDLRPRLSGERPAEVWLPVQQSFALPPGPCQAKLVVRDRGSNAVGSVVHYFEVPKPGRWRISSPILSDVPGGEADARPRLLARRTFAAGSVLYCYFEVYGAARGEAAERPRVSHAYSLVSANGKVQQRAALAPLAPDDRGAMARLIEIPLTRVDPGEYELVLEVHDDSTASTVKLHEPLSVRLPPRLNVGLYREAVRTYLEGDAQQAVSRLLPWPVEETAAAARRLPEAEPGLRRAALLLHTDLALLLWRRGLEQAAEGHVAIGRALLANAEPSALHRDWLLVLAYYSQERSRAREALAFFTECAATYPDAAEAWLGAGTVYEYTAYPDGFGGTQLPVLPREAAGEAERCYRRALDVRPGFTEAKLRLGRVLQRTGRLDEAVEQLSAVLDANESDTLSALAHLFWGQLLEGRGRATDAIDHYRTALAVDPGLQVAALALAHALHGRGQARAAAEVLVPALADAVEQGASTWARYHEGLGRRAGSAHAALQHEESAAGETTP